MPAALHLSLAQAVEEALEANHALKTAKHQNRAAEYDAIAASRSRWGVLNAVGSYSYLNDDQIIRPMSQELLAGGFASAPWDRSQVHCGASYELPLYLGGRLHNQIQIARLEARRSAELVEGTRWQVRFNVVSIYSSIQALDEAAAALDARIGALTQTKTNLDRMVSLGKRPEVDKLKVIEDLESARADRATIAADRRKLAALLLSVLGRDPAGELAVEVQDRTEGSESRLSLASTRPRETTSGTPDNRQPAQVENPRDPPVSRESRRPDNGSDTRWPATLPPAVNENSVIRSARLAAEQAEYGVRMARSEFVPRVLANMNAFENVGTRINRDEETWGATVSVVLPLFEGGARFARLNAARARLAAAEEALKQSQVQTQAAWEDALAKLKAAQTNLEASGARVAAAAEAARIEQVRYDTGSSAIEDLLRARALEQAARAALASAHAGLVIAAERINTIAEKEILQ